MSFLEQHASGERSVARPVDQQSGALPVCCRCPYPVNDVKLMPLWTDNSLLKIHGSIEFFQTHITSLLFILLFQHAKIAMYADRPKSKL